MRGRAIVVVAAALGAAIFGSPVALHAQEAASIVGVVQDSSGAVLPGVTVEAASDVLIEKTRSAVTDGAGRYAIIDLRPGQYAVTFTLSGFKQAVEAHALRAVDHEDYALHLLADAQKAGGVTRGA